MILSAEASYGSGATTQSRKEMQKTESQSTSMAVITEKKSMTVISVWMVWYIRTELRTLD